MPATREQLDNYGVYQLDGPRLNRDVPPTRVGALEQGRLSGIDGRFPGCLRKFYGMLKVLDLDDVIGLGGVDAYDGVSFLQGVIFQKRGTSTTYRGFVVRYDANNSNDNEDVGLVYTADSGATWTYLGVHTGAATGIKSTTALECAAAGAYLMIAVEGKSPKTVYWDGSAVLAVDSGPGAFSATLAALTKASEAQDTSYFLKGNGVYQVRWRFYSSTRGIYSAMSDPVTAFLDQPKLAKAAGTIYLSVYGGDNGLLVAGDVITLNGRTFEYIDAGSHVTIPAAAAATIAAHAQAIADAINGDTANCGCTARAQAGSVYIEASAAGTDGNAIDLAVTEVAPNQDDLTVSGANLTGGGVSTTEYLQQCKLTLDFPANAAVVSGKAFADFAALFDTIDVFRSIDLGQIPAAQQGAIFYNESSIAKTGNWATSGAFDALQVSVGIVPDTALVMLDQYDPSTDGIVAPPASGAIARYQGITLMAQTLTANRPYDILASSLTHVSPEYFTAYNQREGNAQRGRPLRFLVAGDSAFGLHPGGFVHIYKTGDERPVQFVDTINGVGLDGKWAAHVVGNSVMMVSAGLLRAMGGNDGNVVDLPGAGRILSLDWIADLDAVSGGFDAKLNCSLFLDSRRAEVLCIWHGTGGLSQLEGANFAWMTSGPDLATGGTHRAYLVTKQGLVVTPDVAATGSGTMWGLDASYTLNGSATGGSVTTLVSAGATFHADMVGARVYMIDGANAGDWAEIESVDVGNATLTCTAATAFGHAVGYGDRFVVAPVPVHIRLAALRTMDAPGPLVACDRGKMIGLHVKFREIAGLTAGVNDTLRVGVYRDAGTEIEAETFALEVSAVPAAASGAFDNVVSGLDLCPYLEYIGAGSSFEIRDIEVLREGTESKQEP